MSAALRLGCVKYLNARPLIHGWDGPVEFDHPAALCRKLAAGELEVALVSSFEFLRDPIYQIVDRVAVVADGAVESVFLSLGGPLEELREIALDPASRTSVNLLRCLLAEHGFHPRLTTASASEEITRERAQLLIGDQALRFRERHADKFIYWDLAAEWKRLTGLPFVFALWLIRPEVVDAGAIAEALRKQRDRNLARLDEVIAAEKEFTPEFCAHYFRDCLRFEFGDAEKQGLLHFHSLCAKHGIFPSTPLALRLA